MLQAGLWLPLGTPNERSRVAIEKLHRHLGEQGRDPATFGIQAQAQIRGGDPDRWRAHAESWRELGATHLAIATMNAGLEKPQDHIDAIRRYREAVL